jgi:UDPglucose 6-dehydrogenase
LDLDTAVRVNDVIFIAGGTPPAEDASADLRHVEEAARAIGRAMNGHETPYIETGLETAEMIRYASNAFLAVKITFINEVANLCEKVGVNVQEVESETHQLGKFLGAGHS